MYRFELENPYSGEKKEVTIIPRANIHFRTSSRRSARTSSMDRIMTRSGAN